MPVVPVRKHVPRISLPLREARFDDLVSLIQRCRACPRMEGRRRVLTRLNGGPSARVMFIAEAPGRHGADRTGVPIHGDATGVTFERLIGEVGWKREDVFVTNAVLCNPRTEDGNNDKPSQDELRSCSFHLASTIAVVDPAVVVTLGASALESIELIEPHGLVLRSAVARQKRWNGRTLFPLYHQSPRAIMHRNYIKQLEDFRALAKLVNELGVS